MEINTRLSSQTLYELLTENGIDYFCGVPDSLLSPFVFYLEDHAAESHDIAANEGNAIALAIGHYVSTSKVPLVYMQNSGLGNSINPLLSLADPSVLGVPIILLIGWRGQPGKIDEPQHVKQGLITCGLLETLDIPFEILSCDSSEASVQISNAVATSVRSNQPFALLVEDGTLDSYKYEPKLRTSYPLSRERAIELLVSSLDSYDAVIATTGKTSRELFEYRDQNEQSHAQDLLIVGGMGHASSVAYAIAKQQPSRRICVIDGDGAALMHMGSLALNGGKGLKNFYHFVINNGAHESVGGQPTVAFDIDLPAIAKACGYAHSYSAHDLNAVEDIVRDIKVLEGPVFVEIRVNGNSRTDLMRPTSSPSDNKESFMSFLRGT